MMQIIIEIEERKDGFTTASLRTNSKLEATATQSEKAMTEEVIEAFTCFAKEKAAKAGSRAGYIESEGMSPATAEALINKIIHGKEQP